MARPEKYTDADYRSWVEAEVAAGRSVHDIKASELQKSVGGKFSRCQDVLMLVLSEAEELASEPVPPMPAWFLNFVSQLVEQTRQGAESLWLPIGRGMNERVQNATATFEEQKSKFDARSSEQLGQIRILEANADGHAMQVEELQRQLTAAVTELSELKAKKSHVDGELVSIKEQQEFVAKLFSDQKEELRHDRNELNNQLISTIEQNTQLKEQMSTMSTTLESAQEALSSMQSERDRLAE